MIVLNLTWCQGEAIPQPPTIYMLNLLTIDIEDYFQVYALSKVIQYEDWGNYQCRIERNTDRLLEILDHSIQHPTLNTHHSEFKPPTSALTPPTAIHATFFVLGWIAERYPGLIRRIKEAGHEIACHGYAHQLVYSQSRDEFREDIRRSKAILENIIGSEVIGYRAPSYSITDQSLWAFETLVEEGFKYDSSIFPIRHDFYGMPNAPRFPFIISLNGNSNVKFSMVNIENFASKRSDPQTSNTLIEFPISTVKLFGQNFPISGGGYFRLFPYSIVKRALTGINEKEQKPFIFYIHPWEIDFEQPRIPGLKLKSRLRHYINLDKTENKLKILLGDFQFSTIRQFLIQNSTCLTQVTQ